MSRICLTAGNDGQWEITAIHAIAGHTLAPAARLRSGPAPGEGVWTLQGIPSNQRYTERSEDTALRSVQEGLGRSAARQAALIPIRKNAAWWQMPQDERRAIFEASSKHIGIGLEYLPAIARRLLHARDLGEPFDFLTWFEYAPEDQPAFDELLGRLRKTEEWTYIDREVDIRLERRPG